MFYITTSIMRCSPVFPTELKKADNLQKEKDLKKNIDQLGFCRRIQKSFWTSRWMGIFSQFYLKFNVVPEKVLVQNIVKLDFCSNTSCNRSYFCDRFFLMDSFYILDHYHCRPQGRQRLLRACGSMWTKSHKISEDWTLINQALPRIFRPYGLWLLSKSNHWPKHVDISESTDINQSIPMNRFYRIEALMFIQEFFVFS